jgi:FtsP/CotA-like multicopper oxidase with cupredoxin domain
MKQTFALPILLALCGCASREQSKVFVDALAGERGANLACSALNVDPARRGRRKRAALAWLFAAASLLSNVATAEMLIDPPLCSAIDGAAVELRSPFCRVTPAVGKPGQHEVMLSLTTTTSPIYVGGYRLAETDNYNGGYLPPVVELKPGDTFRVRLLNALSPTASGGAAHANGGHGGSGRETNLHTHGLIVTPRNATPDSLQNGDNVFVELDRGQSLDYSIDIPTNLPASVLDGVSGIIPHPNGPYWYHSHRHGTSAMQVAGGMSGLISIGPPKANLVAIKAEQTTSLRDRTDARYLMLRDIQIESATSPEEADGQSPAVWLKNEDDKLCGTPVGGGVPEGNAGYCRAPNDKQRLWLFTVNGQRFPTIKIPSGRNGLWRVANLSANMTYEVSLRDAAGNPVPFDLLSIDGVVPGKPKDPSSPPGDRPAATRIEKSLRLLPAARAEIFIANDNGVATEHRLVLQSDGFDTVKAGESGGDKWPKVPLAEIILEAAPVALAALGRVGLNVPVASAAPPSVARARAEGGEPPALPAGCVRDIDRTRREHRRVTFQNRFEGGWKVTTELVHPTVASGEQPYNQLMADNAETIVASFDQYLKDGAVDWEATGGRPRHTCVRLANGHGQLWALENPTGELHNFHLHQTKFRLANETDLKAYGIEPSSVVLNSGLELKAPGSSATNNRDVWHDTLPIKGGGRIFIVINFDAEEQLGRYVYHCHILKHEDAGLMAPIQVIN